MVHYCDYLRSVGKPLVNCDDMMKTWKLSGIYDEDKLKEAVLRARPDSPADIRMNLVKFLTNIPGGRIPISVDVGVLLDTTVDYFTTEYPLALPSPTAVQRANPGFGSNEAAYSNPGYYTGGEVDRQSGQMGRQKEKPREFKISGDPSTIKQADVDIKPLALPRPVSIRGDEAPVFGKVLPKMENLPPPVQYSAPSSYPPPTFQAHNYPPPGMMSVPPTSQQPPSMMPYISHHHRMVAPPPIHHAPTQMPPFGAPPHAMVHHMASQNQLIINALPQHAYATFKTLFGDDADFERKFWSLNPLYDFFNKKFAVMKNFGYDAGYIEGLAKGGRELLARAGWDLTTLLHLWTSSGRDGTLNRLRGVLVKLEDCFPSGLTYHFLTNITTDFLEETIR